MQGALRRWSGYLRAIEDEWEREGARQGPVLRIAYEALRAAGQKTISSYEELCLEPIRAFKQMYGFAGLRWTDRIGSLIEEKSRGGDRSDPFGTSRDSSSLAWAWNEIDPGALQGLRKGYRAFELPLVPRRAGVGA